MTSFRQRIIAQICIAGIAAAAIAAVSTAPAAAQSRSESVRLVAGHSVVPDQLSRSEAKHYRELFQAIDRQDWAKVENLLEKRDDGLLHQVALAEYYTHAKSPKVSAGQIADWFALGTDLPQAEQLTRMGAKRGLENTPSLPRANRFSRQPAASKRLRPRTINDSTMPRATRNAILERIKNDDPDGARILLDGIDSSLSSAARAEWRQRIAWSYYIENRDSSALAMARTVSQGSGAWVAEGEWVVGLAAWRLNDCASAAQGFANSGRLAQNVELKAASYYWASRAFTRCRMPGDADENLRIASRYDETLYGMLAMEQLGINPPVDHNDVKLSRADWKRISKARNVRVAAGLAEIGRDGLADEVLRHQARIGSPQDYDALSRFARELGMPSTQLWMAHNAPRGASSQSALRYPTANWQPISGWRVDPALAFAHALQESNFRASAVSPANARGLMQIMPGTARDHNRRLNLGASYADLNKPEVNLAYGQQHLEMLRDSGATQGKLPKVMAAYNAGLSPISRWNSEVDDRGDPLLYMESIPYWETRGYVSIVMRNFWMYQRQAGNDSPSRRAMAEGQWPAFPDGRQFRTAWRGGSASGE